jgi:hypothetical protein
MSICHDQIQDYRDIDLEDNISLGDLFDVINECTMWYRGALKESILRKVHELKRSELDG